MKLKIKCSELLKQLNICQRIASSSISPILGNVKIRAFENEIELTASDLEIYYKSNISAEVETEGAVCVPVKNITEIINTIPGDEILDISINDDFLMEVKFSKGKSKRESVYTIFGNNPEDFPSLPDEEQGTYRELSLSVFQDMLNKTSYAMSTDEAKRELCGLLIQSDGHMLNVVATDGRRLGNSFIETSFDKCEDIIIPAKVIGEIKKMEGDNFHIFISKQNIIFKIDNVSLMSRLIEGKYPDYKAVIPDTKCCTIKADRKELLALIRGIMPIAKEVSFTVKCVFEKDSLTMTALSSKIGKGKRIIDIENDGDDITIAFNARYLQDCINSIDTEFVIIEPTSTVKATKILPYGVSNHVNICMPVKT